MQIDGTIVFGLLRLMLTVTSMRGLSTSTTAIQATSVNLVTAMFGWYVSDSVLKF